jgi:hypothetical protein
MGQRKNINVFQQPRCPYFALVCKEMDVID